MRIKTSQLELLARFAIYTHGNTRYCITLMSFIFVQAGSISQLLALFQIRLNSFSRSAATVLVQHSLLQFNDKCNLCTLVRRLKNRYQAAM